MNRSCRVTSCMMLMAACAVLPQAASAQDSYPSKPIRIIVPYSAGTPPDVVTRIIANKLTGSMGQTVIVDNRPGATGTVGLQELMRQPADGYTIMTMLQPVTVAPALYGNFPYDFGRDLAAVGQFTTYYNVLVVHPTVPARNVAELVGLIKAKPTDFNFGSGGNGTPAHLAGELFKLQAGVGSAHVGYNQFPQAVADLVGGRLQYMFITSSVIVPHIQTGKVRALAVTGAKRIAALPDVPTMIEAGYELRISDEDGLVVRTDAAQRD